MTDLNSVVLMGNLVKDNQVKEIGNAKLSNFTLAINRSIKKGDQWETEVSYIDCVLWNKENLLKYLNKGVKVTVEGYLKQDRWEKDGVKNSRVSVVVNNIYLNGNNKKSDNKLTNVTESNNIENEEFPEDIPF